MGMCPYCEEEIEYLAYNGEDFFCHKCDTIVATDIFEASAFVKGTWDGRGDFRTA